MTQSVRAALHDAVSKLQERGVPGSARDARLLLREALGVDATQLTVMLDDPLPPGPAALFSGMIDKRCKREPPSRILGMREFWSLPFRIAPETLDPRPETEGVVEAALGVLPSDRRAEVLDLGTGSGCILLAVLSERPSATGIGVDISAGAVAMAKANADLLGLGDRSMFREGDWAAGLSGQFDLVVSNPPYIVSGEIGALAPEVRDFDPAMALDGGSDGLDAYRAIADVLPALLLPLGAGVFEIGHDQGATARKIFEKAGFDVSVRQDLANLDRVLIVQRL